MLTEREAQVASQVEVRRFLKQLLAVYLNVAPEQLTEDESFFSLGLTSLIHSEVLWKLTEAFGELSSTVLFEHPNLGLLTEHLAQRHPLRKALERIDTGTES